MARNAQSPISCSSPHLLCSRREDSGAVARPVLQYATDNARCIGFSVCASAPVILRAFRASIFARTRAQALADSVRGRFGAEIVDRCPVPRFIKKLIPEPSPARPHCHPDQSARGHRRTFLLRATTENGFFSLFARAWRAASHSTQICFIG